MEFTGFSPETFDFLWGIRLNNNRDWFLAHKEDYLAHLYRPMQALGEALYEPFREVPGMRCKVSRIYRDLRMPHADGPYKESLWISLRPDAFYWGETPCLFFDIHPEQASCGFVFWHPVPALMERFRRDLAAQPDRFLAIAETAERKTGLTLSGQEYRKKKPCADPRAERFMSLKNFLCERDFEPGPALFDASLADTVRKTLLDLLPLYEYFLSIE